MKKQIVIRKVLYIVSLSFFALAGLHRIYAQEIPKQDCEKLKKDYEALLVDRDNLISQSSISLEDKTKIVQAEAAIKQLNMDNEKLKKDLQARLEQNSLLQQKIEELERDSAQLVQDKESAKNELEKWQIEYKIVPETRKEITKLQGEKGELLRKYNEVDKKIKYLEEHKLDADAEIEIYRRQVNDFKKRYDEALAKNRELEKKAAMAPERLAELARENKVLVKETALMHYNLGVFYTQNKEYSRAIAEFEKAVELNPDDAYAYYNLGYIYAEYVVDRNRAIGNFRKFLKLTKSEDKDVDWVKKYILTWQTWEGKKPAE